MSLLANIKKACLSRTPDRGRSPSDSGRSPFDSGRSPFDSERSPFDSGGSPFDSERSLSDSVGSPFEDYESDKSLQAIDQLVGQDVTMQQDGKETSQPATNRCLHGNNGVAAGNEGHTTSSHPRRVSTPQRNQAATSKHNKEESSQLKPQTGVTESETKRGCLFSEMKDKGKIVNQMKKFTSKLAFPHSRTPTREVTTKPEGEKEPTKTYGVQLLNIPKISKKFQRSRVIKSPPQDQEEASIDIFELFIKSLDSTDSEEPEKLHRKSEEGTEMKISTSSEVPPDDLQKEHISSQFKRKHVTIQGEPKQDEPKGQDRQEKEANKGTPRSTGLQQKTHLKEVPATNLSGTLKTEDRLFNIGGVENEITEDMFRCMSPVSSSDCPTFDDLRLIFKNLKIDPVSQVEVMKMVWKYMCSLNNEKRHTEQMSCDISFLQTDKIDLQGNMERLKASFTEVESNLMQLQKENTNLKYRLQQHTTTEQVRDIKTQHQAGVQKKAKLEFSLRRVEEENIKLLNQHEREYNDVHSLATQEQCAREELQKQLDSCLRRQQELEEENSSNKRKCNKVLGQLTEASNKEKAMRQEIDALRDQLSTLKREGGLRENVLLEEKELFQEQLQDTVRNYKVGANALNKQIECLNSRLSDTKTLHENERVTRERLEAELKTIQCQLAEVEKKADLSHIAQSDIQRTLSQENERQEQLINNLKEKIINMQKKYNHLSQKLQQAKDSESDMEKKAKQLTQQLQENVLKQKVLQQEKDQADTDFIMREKNMQARICSLQDEKKEIKACLQKTEEELDETLKKLSMSEGAVEVSKQFQLELEEERSQLIRNLDTFEQQMEKDKDMHNVLMQEKNAVERRLHQEMTKASDLEKQNYRIQASLRNKRKKLQDLDNDQAESLRRMKDEISKMQHKLDIEGTIRSQMEQETNYLRDQLDQCARKNGELEKEALDLRYQMLILQSEHCGEIQWDHQQQQEQLKQFQQASPKLQDQKKTAKMDITNSEVEERFEKLENELSRVIESQDATQRELERSRQLYIQQVDTNRALERKLQRTKNRLTETSEMLFRQGPTCTTSHVS